MNDEMETISIEWEAERCENAEDIRALIHRCEKYYTNWKKYINCLVDESGLSYNQLAQRCGISKNTLKKWCIQGGLPRSRNTLLKLGFGLGMNVDQVNRLLTRFGGYYALYPKDLFDAACIFTLKRNSQGLEGYDFAYAESLYDRCLPVKYGSGVDTAMTTEVMHKLYELNNEADFAAFAEENRALLNGKRTKLEQYLRDFIALRQREVELQEEQEISWHRLARSKGMSPEFEKLLSLLHTHGIIPKRGRLIALGLNLCMTLDELNQMLTYAGMERLCAKDKLECILIYALQNICLLHPELALGNAMQLHAVTRSIETKQQCEALVKEYMDACYHSEDNDWSEFTDYIRYILKETGPDEAEELLNLL